MQWEQSCSIQTEGPSDTTKLIVTVRMFALSLKFPAVYLNRTKSADSKEISTAQHEVTVLKLTAFS